MPSHPRYLSKSRFKLANECPTKLFYTGKKQVYPDASFDDEFLAALAEGGFQVGELAKALFPGGHDIQELGYEQSLQRTAALLEQENVVIFEPAFRYQGLFVRVDILVKSGCNIELIEVKAKSCKGAGEEQFLGKKPGSILSKWRPYLEDVVFQHYVVAGAFPEWKIQPYIMLVDKTSTSPTSGLHQKFLLRQGESGRSYCENVTPLCAEEESGDLLIKIPLHESFEIIRNDSYGPGSARNFDTWITYLAGKYSADERIWTPPSPRCGSCQFQANTEELAAGCRSGLQECWQHAFNLSAEELQAPTVLEVWGSRKKKKWLEERRPLLRDLDASDFGNPQTGRGAMETQERQWIQVRKAQQQETHHDLRLELKGEMDSWKFPLHFIDFETMAPAIPMHAGCRPYEMLAFQFSHHVMQQDGSVAHVGEYIEERCGAFPNFDFVRALKKELENDDGTIFRYATHENSVLGSIREQLLRAQTAHHGFDLGDDTLEDAHELVAFIESISQPPQKNPDAWNEGPRNMVDLLVMVRKYYFDPRMKGSNSIKQVLPAVINTSEFLQKTYSKAIYGTATGIASKNFSEQAWVQESDGEFLDPYKLLPTMFEGFSEKDRLNLLSGDGSVDNGGAAMTAFARMQFTEMGEQERRHLRKLLLKYCELDTLAMVMIVQAWQEWLDT